MRHSITRYALPLAAALVLALPLAAQAQQKQAPQKGPPPQAAPKPYASIAVKLPAPLNDASLEALRKQLAEAASKKDRGALARLVVAQGFFWDGEKGDQADKKKTAADNLATALALAGKQTIGWEMLEGFSQDPTAGPHPDPARKGVVCSPADPTLDEKQLEEAAKSVGADPGEFGYPLAPSVEVRSGPKADSPVIEKLGTVMIRMFPDPKQAAPAQNQVPMVRVVTPSGKVGFVSADILSPLGNDQLCYLKEGNAWKIAGFVGAGAAAQGGQR